MDKMQAFFFGLANMKKEMYSMCLFFSLYLKDVRFWTEEIVFINKKATI